MLKNTEHAYGKLAVSLHWVSAIFILTMIPLGFLMQQASDGNRLTWYRIHAVIGCFILLLTLVRVFWKWIDNTPHPPEGLGKIHLKGMKFIHALLYLILLILSLNGIILLFQSGLVDVLRGTVHEFPQLENFASRRAHGILARIFMGLLAAHIGGVILHQIRTGHVFSRMGIGKPKP